VRLPRTGSDRPPVERAAGPSHRPGTVPAPEPAPGVVPGVHHVVAVSSGKGGVGKSTVARCSSDIPDEAQGPGPKARGLPEAQGGRGRSSLPRLVIAGVGRCHGRCGRRPSSRQPQRP
jgi:hypothetical protein